MEMKKYHDRHSTACLNWQNKESGNLKTSFEMVWTWDYPVWGTKRKKNEEKWREPQRPVEHHQVPEKQEWRKVQKNIWINNGGSVISKDLS